MREAYFTVSWALGEMELNGPYDSFDTAKDILGEETLGNDRQGAVVGPLPFKQVIEDGKWMTDTNE